MMRDFFNEDGFTPGVGTAPTGPMSPGGIPHGPDLSGDHLGQDGHSDLDPISLMPDYATMGELGARPPILTPGPQRLTPYLTRSAAITYNSTAGAPNVCSLGGPDKGYRWVLRSVSIAPAGGISDSTSIAVVSGWYITTGFANAAGGTPAAPPLTDFRFLLNVGLGITMSTTLNIAAGGTQFTSNSHTILPGQHLLAQIVNQSSTAVNGYTYIFNACFEQFPDRQVGVREVL